MLPFETSNPKLVGLCLAIQIPVALISTLVNKYLFNDFEFLKWLIVVCFLDLLTGMWKVWITQGYQAITSRGIRDTVSKIIQYGSFLIITHVLTHFQIGGKATYFNWQWINDVAYEFLILIEIKSVYENIVRINPKMDFMKPILEKLTQMFKKEGE